MSTSHPNPYEPSRHVDAPKQNQPKLRGWLLVFTVLVCAYYVISALTLPAANKIWLGEIPLLALVQIPKAFLKTMVHKALMHAMHGLGISYGSFSPDFGATHGWAMLIMLTLPALLFATVLMRARGLEHRNRWVGLVLLLAAIDGMVTIWFDSVSRLKLFNGW
jgi:hypothetical protein